VSGKKPAPARLPAGLKRRTVCQMLFTAARLVDERAQARVNRAAGRRVMRPAVARVIPYLGHEGIRLVDLARRLDVSKQAVGQTVAELQADGLVELVPDPADGRAKLVRLTARGVEAVGHGVSVLQGIEAELGERLGPARLEQLRGLLADVLDELEGDQGGPASAAPTSAT
jgi:DNA-binding MarR family transcriptional regulator